MTMQIVNRIQFFDNKRGKKYEIISSFEIAVPIAKLLAKLDKLDLKIDKVFIEPDGSITESEFL